jgi:uroporphyrinogen decarboxylase
VTSRERVKRTIAFETPDKLPITHSALGLAHTVMGPRLGEIMRSHPGDFSGPAWKAPEGYEVIDVSCGKGGGKDEWGCVWENLYDGMAGQVVVHPLADLDDLDTYQFPDLANFGDFSETAASIERIQDYYILSCWISFFERMQWLRGYAALLEDLADPPKRLYELRDKLLEVRLGQIHRWLQYDIDGIQFSDDWGTQEALMISPRRWREFFKPVYAAMFEPIKRAGKHVHLHTDGFTMEIIPDLIELGVDVLNPQHVIMDTREVGRRFAGSICFRSDLDRQFITPHGTPEQVRAHVREVVESLSTPKGGLILHGEIGPEMPIENVEAMYEAFEEYRILG